MNICYINQPFPTTMYTHNYVDDIFNHKSNYTVFNIKNIKQFFTEEAVDGLRKFAISGCDFSFYNLCFSIINANKILEEINNHYASSNMSKNLKMFNDYKKAISLATLYVRVCQLHLDFVSNRSNILTIKNRIKEIYEHALISGLLSKEESIESYKRSKIVFNRYNMHSNNKLSISPKTITIETGKHKDARGYELLAFSDGVCKKNNVVTGYHPIGIHIFSEGNY